MIPIPPIAIKAVAVLAALGVAGAAGYFNGKASVQKSWDAAIMRQTTKTMSQVIAEAQVDGSSIKQYIEVQGKTREKIKIVEKKEFIYVTSPTKKCDLDADFVRVGNAYIGVYNHASHLGVQAAEPDAADSDELSGS